jgi:hypothetical protein
MPDWKIHTHLDFQSGLQVLSISNRNDGMAVRWDLKWRQRAMTCAPEAVELPLREILDEAIDLLERRHQQQLALRTKILSAIPLERIREALWESPSETWVAFFFHPSLSPAESLADAICQRAGAGDPDEWTESTFQRLTALFGALAQRPLRFFRGANRTTMSRLRREGLQIVRIVP